MPLAFIVQTLTPLWTVSQKASFGSGSYAGKTGLLVSAG